MTRIIFQYAFLAVFSCAFVLTACNNQKEACNQCVGSEHKRWIDLEVKRVSQTERISKKEACQQVMSKYNADVFDSRDGNYKFKYWKYLKVNYVAVYGSCFSRLNSEQQKKVEADAEAIIQKEIKMLEEATTLDPDLQAEWLEEFKSEEYREEKRELLAEKILNWDSPPLMEKSALKGMK